MTDNVPATTGEEQPEGGALAEAQQGGAIATSQNVIDETTSGAGFLPYLQLFTSKSSACTEGKIGIGRYGLVEDGNITDLGEEINVYVGAARPRAFQKCDDGNIIVIHDKTDPEYVRIQELQKAKVNGCMAGPEVIVFIETAERWASFFCGSPTLRREAKKFKPLFGKCATLKTKLIAPPGNPHKWHGPVIVPCSVGIDPFPDDEEIAEQLKAFNNPPKSKVKRAEESEEDEVDR